MSSAAQAAWRLLSTHQRTQRKRSPTLDRQIASGVCRLNLVMYLRQRTAKDPQSLAPFSLGISHSRVSPKLKTEGLRKTAYGFWTRSVLADFRRNTTVAEFW